VFPLVLLLSLLLVFKTGTNGLINFGDSVFPFFPQEHFQQLLYLWGSHNVVVPDSPLRVVQISWYGLVALLDKLGVSLWLINRLWFVLPFLLLGLAMYFLSGVVLGREKKISRLVATLFFMFNPFTVNLAAGSNVLTLGFAGGVFVFGLFVRGLERRKLDIKDAVLLGLASVLVVANPVVLALVAFLCALYFLFFVFVNRHDHSRFRYALKFSLIASAYYLITNFWWLLPLAHQAVGPGGLGAQVAAGTDVGTLEFISEHTSLFDVSRLFYGYQPSYFFPISNYYHYLLSPTIMSILVVLVFAVSLFKKKSKFEIFFLVLAWISVILASGTRPPFGFVYQFLWDRVPYFHIFRTTNHFNLWTMISYSILLGFLYQKLTKDRMCGLLSSLKFPRFYDFFIVSFLLISIFLSAWPLLSGNIYDQLQPHQIPQDYYDLREFLKNQEGDFRVMSLPMISWLAAYSWSAPFDMQEILLDFSPKDTIVNMPGYYDNLMQRELSDDDPLYAVAYYYLSRSPADLEAMYSKGEASSPERVAYYKELAGKKAVKALRLMGVRYLVVHQDYVVIYHGFPRVDISVLVKNIKDNKELNYVTSFGDLDVYEVDGFYPRLYAFLEGQTLIKGLTLNRVSPVEYQIQVQGADTPFDLIFAENFNRGWRLNGEPPTEGLARGFGNVWQLDKTGDYEMRLYYQPQRLLEVGFLISTVSLVGGFFVLLLRKK